MKGRVYLLRRREKRAGRRGKKKRAGATESDPKDRVLETHQIYDLRIQMTTRRAPFWETPKFQKTGSGGPEVCVGLVELESNWKHVTGA